jgi:phosphonate transport system permease protein
MARKNQPQAAKPPLFDRVFPPKMMAVGGRTVPKPRSRAWLIWLVMIAAVWGSVALTEFDLGIIVRRRYQFTVILEKIFNPDWGYFDKVIPPLLDTIKMSVIGSAIGSLISLPFAVMASANINKSGFSVSALRVVLNVLRTLPTLVIASVCALIFGLGTFAGTVAITVFTFGIVAKMLYESIETIDMGAFEAMEALGASKFQAFWSAVFPQILPTYLSHCLYSFEINIRAASILGYVGAGGLGILINERIGWRDYEGLGTVLIALFVVVLIIENTSQALRRRLS